MCYSIEEIRRAVLSAVDDYQQGQADSGPHIKRVALFGSYAEGRANDASDVDLLITFSDPVVSFFTLARALEAMEGHFNVPVDIVQDPLPDDSLLMISKEVPLYEAA